MPKNLNEEVKKAIVETFQKRINNASKINPNPSQSHEKSINNLSEIEEKSIKINEKSTPGPGH